MAYKRKYHRGARITSLDELLEEKSVYMGTWDHKPKPVAVLKCMTVNTVLSYMDGSGLYKTVLGDGPDEPSGLPVEPIVGQTNMFVEE